MDGLRICRLGHFSPRYARNRIVAAALSRAGASVEDVHDGRSLPVRTVALVSRALRKRCDLILVGFPGHTDVPAASLVGHLEGVPVVFDALLSLYETFVTDRGRISRRSLRARVPALIDRTACLLADRILLDTDAHIDYFVRRFGIPPRKFHRIWVGADEEVMSPRPRTGDPVFSVFMYGSFIPLHGIEHVVRAAHILEARGAEFRLTIVGNGQTYPAVRALADGLGVRSVRFLGTRPFTDLPGLMAENDVCLGIFGTSPKAARVIPNKVFDGLAAGRAVVTADTPAVREALVHGDHAWLCPRGDPAGLADALLALRGDPDLRARLAQNGRRRFEDVFSTDAIGRQLVAAIGKVLAR